MVDPPRRMVLSSELELELPDGNLVLIRPGPYKKGLAVVPVTRANGHNQRGRRPRQATVLLRERLRRDAARGNVRPAGKYVQWYLEQEPEVSLATARQIVYRERRALQEKQV